MKKQSFKNVTIPDYKDIQTLRTFLDSYGRVVPRKVSGITARQQKAIARAVKQARFMGFLPYIAR